MQFLQCTTFSNKSKWVECHQIKQSDLTRFIYSQDTKSALKYRCKKKLNNLQKFASKLFAGSLGLGPEPVLIGYERHRVSLSVGSHVAVLPLDADGLVVSPRVPQFPDFVPRDGVAGLVATKKFFKKGKNFSKIRGT